MVYLFNERQAVCRSSIRGCKQDLTIRERAICKLGVPCQWTHCRNNNKPVIRFFDTIYTGVVATWGRMCICRERVKVQLTFAAVLLFQPKCQLYYPENGQYSFSNRIFSGSKYPTITFHTILKTKSLIRSCDRDPRFWLRSIPANILTKKKKRKLWSDQYSCCSNLSQVVYTISNQRLLRFIVRNDDVF